MNLILFGFKGAGKTYLGRRLALELQLPFIDTDDLIGSSVRAIYAKLGETQFRALEKKVIFSLKKEPRSVISLGGGAILDRESRAHLETIGKLIYLDVSFEIIEQRLGSFSLGEKSLRTLFFEREPLYKMIEADRINANHEECFWDLIRLARSFESQPLASRTAPRSELS